MVCDAPASIKQELMMAPILFLVPVDPEKSKEVTKVAPYEVLVVTQLPSKSQPIKPSLGSYAQAKPK